MGRGPRSISCASAIARRKCPSASAAFTMKEYVCPSPCSAASSHSWRARRQRLEPGQRAPEVIDRRLVEVGASRFLPRLEQILHRLLGSVAVLVVVRELLVVLVQIVPVQRLHRLRYLPVKQRPA